ncbi:quinoprotein dehydrogenase-associated SoxYZ-like carrier [Methylobrevis pamukkalensis]|uniref:Sulfur oxidation protein SoxY n=1 Tax=Methylobrevis pamukkalensis TaxID=1439726 RepID=A0A1E3H2X4_9HYPH|nr:quinoprotein dehydrogenase-associated SoxYZ-like carrier [Methylobrevis pamukkalensis]ODN70677.1 sulfur oxidation protein SoxY [Methylobrevis pamukkalensis]
MLNGEGIITLGAPYRAEDAAIVPMTLDFALPEGDPDRIVKVTLVIDENPAPVAATFTLGETAAVGHIETRVRVNAYTKVHAVAETGNGRLFVTERFVKASGGCSAPASKDQALALADLGRMKFREFPAAAGGGDLLREAQVMIKHPNNSGLQRDDNSYGYIPARFINELTVSQGDEMILKMEGGISISEDPNFRFSYRSNGATISVKATDTDGVAFDGTFPQSARSGT